MSEVLKKFVLEAARNAHENGYEAWESSEALAQDMCSYDSFLEDYEPEEVQRVIEELKLLQPVVGGAVRSDTGEPILWIHPVWETMQ